MYFFRQAGDPNFRRRFAVRFFEGARLLRGLLDFVLLLEPRRESVDAIPPA